LLNEFENPDKNIIIPAMLYWLYFGQSFERMVEIGEELRRTPDISYIRKFLIKSTIYAYLDSSVQKYDRPEIEALMNYFKLN
jgi:hypothetical protein